MKRSRSPYMLWHGMFPAIHLLETSARRGGVRCLLCETWAPLDCLSLSAPRPPARTSSRGGISSKGIVGCRWANIWLHVYCERYRTEGGGVVIKEGILSLVAKEVQAGGDFTLLFSINLSTRVIACSKERDQKERGDLWKAWDSKACRARLKRRKETECRIQNASAAWAVAKCTWFMFSFVVVSLFVWEFTCADFGCEKAKYQGCRW